MIRRARHVIVAAVLACAAPRTPAPADGGASSPTANATSTATPTAPSPQPSPPLRGGEGVISSTATSTATATPTSTSSDAPPPTQPPPRDLTSGLPPPLPPPDAIRPPVEPSDPLDLLWNHRLEFTREGEPLVTIRLVEGQDEIAFRPGAAGRVILRGASPVAVRAGARFVVRARRTTPAAVSSWPLLAEATPAQHAALEEARREWEGRGVPGRVKVVGGVYGIGGNVVDTRRELLLADGDGGARWARATLERLRARGERVRLFTEVASRPSGRLSLSGPGGAALGEADTVLAAEVDGDGSVTVEHVERESGSGTRSGEDRRYRGRLYVTVDARGKLAAVLAVPLEVLLRGIVPSEMPASVPLEALKAQAVTARSNVLAQIGTRHLTDPWMLCADVHCQAYRGSAAERPRPDAAVRATAGEALFRGADHTLVDAVYHAMCGGHGEDNEAVWGNPPDPSLRGRPDLPPSGSAAWAGGLREEARLRRFLSAPVDAFCRRATLHRNENFRWERRLDPAALDAIAAPLGVGHVLAIDVEARGASGRARAVRIEGAAGEARLSPELRIRRALGNLPSAMFVVDRDGDAFLLRGGGWGHGAGMCQWGAVGRAEAGQGYREILRAYYSGAEVAKIY